MPLNPFQQNLKTAYCKAVPLIAVSTQDQSATLSLLPPCFLPDLPILSWDIVSGVKGTNDTGEYLAEYITSRVKDVEDLQGRDGFRALVSLMRESFDSLPYNAFCLVALNLHRGLDDSSVIQTIANCRNWLAQGGTINGQVSSSCLVLLAPSFTFPAELSQDIYSLTDDPPQEARLREIILDVCSWSSVPVPQEPTLTKAAESLLSLSEFSAQQEVALAVSSDPSWTDSLGDRRRIRVNETPGLELFSGKTSFRDIGGYEEIKSFFSLLFNGPMGFRSLFFVDEIEKGLGSASDSSGVSLRMLGTILSYMSDNNVSGILLHGVPGAGKSAVSQACSGEFKVPFVSADLSAMQNSLVGKSEENLRRALEIDKSLGRGKSLWISTCNDIEKIPAPLLSRFDLGVFTFDLPSEGELSSIWPIQLAAHGLDISQPLPNSAGWTGREIKAACKKAFALGLSVVDASKYVIPLSISKPEDIEKCHREAAGKLLSASYPGPFVMPKESKRTGRAIQQESSPTIILATPSPYQFTNAPEQPFTPKPRIGFGEDDPSKS
jgi:hypothetical protein